ncbi:MAG: hypothetical protein M3Z10_04175 [Gemmatimonadota bacterium]|jgi:hypothetical protein|nr:hypothetical protein [Gemmatimonadota bacterium]
MAAGPKLDGAGIQKMKTLDEAFVQVQRLHGVVEQYALALKRSQPTSLYGMQVKRAISPIVGLLKPQFGLISDQVAALNLVAGRGGSEQTKVRILREGVGALRQALDIAVVRVKDNHAVHDEPQPTKTPSAES